MEFCIVIQARLGSKRFPAKILKTIYKNYNSLTFLINLVRKTDYELVVTTTKSSVDNKIVNICKKKILIISEVQKTMFMRGINKQQKNIISII